MNIQYLPVVAVSISLLAVPLIILLNKKPNLREAVSLLAGVVKLGCVIALVPHVLNGEQIEIVLWEFEAGLPIAFRVDGLGLLFAFVAASLWIVTTAYSIGYMRTTKSKNLTRFYSYFAISLAATLGVAFSANLLTLYLFYEALSLATFPLVTHNGDGEARSGGRRYLYFLLTTSIGLVLPAMLYIYGQVGDLNFQPGGVLVDSGMSQTTLLVLLLAFVFGFAKAALMPFHGWLPGAMVAPTPVSALLHAVAVVKVGVFSILRIITGIFGTDFMAQVNWHEIVTWVAAGTVVISSLIALSQDNLKRRLAYSTIGQLAYIILGASLLTDRAVTGSSLHILMHAFGKITLFFCAGAIYVASGKKYISQMVGLGRIMPWTMAAFLIGSMSVIGLPPTGGFVSKWLLLMGALDARMNAVVVVYLVSSLLNAAYFLPIVFRGFYVPGDDPTKPVKMKEAPLWCLIPLWITALISIALFFLSDTAIRLIEVFLGVGV